jgi:manganese transport protein
LRQANKFNLIDSIVALNAAFFVNAAILMLAAAAFHSNGRNDIASLEDAHALLQPMLGSMIAPIAFAVALLAAGQSSTITGTLAGQIVMEGFVHIRLRPWLRRLITRSIAVVPAVLVVIWQGDRAVDTLLVLSQVILSLQLSFAVVPLIHFTGDRRKMGQFVTPFPVRILAWVAALIIMGLNLKYISEAIFEGIDNNNPLVKFILLPVSLGLVPLLAWMIFEPLWSKLKEHIGEPLRTPDVPSLEATIGHQFRRIGIALEATKHDEKILAGVVPIVRAAGADVVLIHVVESATARFIGDGVDDREARSDTEYLLRVTEALRAAGLTCKMRIGAGEPEDEIARIAGQENLDLIVTGGHGHRLFGDLLHGSTASELRHRTKIPVLTVRT